MTNSEKAKDDSLKYYKRLTVEMLNEVLLKLEEEKKRQDRYPVLYIFGTEEEVRKEVDIFNDVLLEELKNYDKETPEGGHKSSN
jgi:hypothetical protein